MIIYDATREQIKGDSRILCDEVGCQVYKLEKDTPPANRVERYIKMIKDGAKKDLVISNPSIVFWNFCMEEQAQIVISIAKNNADLQGQVPHTRMTG